jgi:cytochrome c554/c'-like protein
VPGKQLTWFYRHSAKEKRRSAAVVQKLAGFYAPITALRFGFFPSSSPAGRKKIAHRFNGGFGVHPSSSPAGTAEIYELGFCRPCGTRRCLGVYPSDKSLGYFLSSWRTDSPRPYHILAIFIFVILISVAVTNKAFGEEPQSTAAPKFLGSQSCSASSCHGGASEKSKQYTIWSTHDFHHLRPYATLETARSERLAEVLKIANPAQSARCTVCHAPFATVPSERLGHDAQISEGISCESCHGPAENWIRSHTRPDYTHADRVAAGMRDLKNLYVRANTCVACHQNIDPEIRAAGHPELIFELDGQSVTMPRHWSTSSDKPSPQIWAVGQLVALREISWQLQIQKKPTADLTNQWVALASMFFLTHGFPGEYRGEGVDFEKAMHEADHLAQQTAAKDFDPGFAKGLLEDVARDSRLFNGENLSRAAAARYAERIVLGLDRLVGSLPTASTNSAVNQSLNKLFADAQSLPDFDPNQFAKDLNTFHSSVAGFLETK